MLRGTTPVVTLTLPAETDLSSVAVMYMSFGQGGKDLFDVDIDDLTIDDNTVTAQLTQAQTLLLDATQKTQIQLRWRDSSGDAYGTYIVKVSTEAILKEGVI